MNRKNASRKNTGGVALGNYGRIALSVSLLLILVLSLSSCKVQKIKTLKSDRYLFGTVCSITVYNSPLGEKKTKKILNNVWTEMQELENRISSKDENADIYKYNHGEINTLNPDAEKLLETAKVFMAYTDNSFSPYLDALSELWGIGTDNARVPSDDEIKAALKEKQLDFGALGKGYASDIAHDLLKKAGITSAIINFGGNICVVGGKPTGYTDPKTKKPETTDFVIGIQDPDLSRGGFRETVPVRDACVISSGDYERFFEHQGVRYCHIFDAKTGYPVRNGLRQVTIIGPEGLICDALSTTLFIAGEEKGKEILRNYPEYRAIFVYGSEN